jgi:hypothetical protein
MIRHRGTCEADNCGRVWRENCEHCLTEVASRHTAQTGHPVHLQITPEKVSSWELQGLIRGLRPAWRGW